VPQQYLPVLAVARKNAQTSISQTDGNTMYSSALICHTHEIQTENLNLLKADVLKLPN